MKNNINDLIFKYTISKGGRDIGITLYDIEKYILTPDQFIEFNKWITGSTMGCVDNTCNTGLICPHDLKMFLRI